MWENTIYDISVALDTVLIVRFALLAKIILPELGVVLNACLLTTVGVLC